MEISWEDGLSIRATNDGGAVTVSANPAGLRSLAGILTALAEETPGSHIHLDESNALEDGSTELILVRTDTL